MYALSTLTSHVNKAWEIAKQIGISEEVNPGAAYDGLSAATTKALTYLEEYTMCLDKGYWNILLKDRSIIQFKIDVSDPRSMLSYVYLECPYRILSHAQFLVEVLELPSDQIVRVGDMFRDEYERYLDQPDTLKEHVTPVRYDYSPALYNCGRHPASHFHFGIKNPLRIATGRILRPTSFVCFVARQWFPLEWHRFINGKNGASRHARQVYRDLLDVPIQYLSGHDLWETGFDLPRGGPSRS